MSGIIDVIDLTQEISSNEPRNKLYKEIQKMIFNIQKKFNRWCTQQLNIDEPKLLATQSSMQKLYFFHYGYKNMFKIVTQVRFTLYHDLSINLKSVIKMGSQIINSIFQFRKKLIRQIDQSKFEICFTSPQTIEIRARKFSTNRYFQFFSETIFSSIENSFTISKLLHGYLDEKKEQKFKQKILSETENQNFQKLIEPLDKIKLIEKQNINLSKICRSQRKGKYFIKDPKYIKKQKQFQILRQMSITKQLFKKSLIGEQKFQGAYSKLFYLRCICKIVDTYYHYRANMKEQAPQLFENSNQKKLELIQKRSNDENQQSAAKKSFNNEIQFLELKGSSKCPYICNYYFNLKDMESSQKPLHIQDGNKVRIIAPNKSLYAQFHAICLLQILTPRSQFQKITITDLLNLIEQIILGLLQFYIANRFIHRDIKSLNILVNSEGIIQIIDHGSIYPLQKDNASASFQKFLKGYDAGLRSTFYVGNECFNDCPKIKKKYTQYKIYGRQNSVHHTFDVFSVGVVLNNARKVYQRFTEYSTMQINQRLKRLISKMTQYDFQDRISMETALRQLRSIKSVLLH